MKKYLSLFLLLFVFAALNTGCNSNKNKASNSFKATRYNNGTIVLKDKSSYAVPTGANERLKELLKDDTSIKSIKIGPNEMHFGSRDKKF